MGVMLKHPVLPNVDLSALRLLDVHAEWLQAWLREIDTEVENGVVSSALCLQGLLSEVALYRQPRRHWAEVAEEYLTAANGFPIAYSEKYGLKLHKFERLWEQVTVHAVYSRWWVESYYQTSASIDFGRLIETFIQPDGWIYNPSVSPTRFRYRMKSEYFMSLALGVEILKAAGFSADHQAQFESTISAHPLTGYLSAEYFRLAALDQLNARRLAPAGLAAMLEMAIAIFLSLTSAMTIWAQPSVLAATRRFILRLPRFMPLIWLQRVRPQFIIRFKHAYKTSPRIFAKTLSTFPPSKSATSWIFPSAPAFRR